jgi:hypothetical protein
VFSHCYSLGFLATLNRALLTACRIRQTVSSDISILNTLSAKHAEGVLATTRCHARGAIVLDERAAKKVNNDRRGAA